MWFKLTPEVLKMWVSAEALLCTLPSSLRLESDSSIAQYLIPQQAAMHCTQPGTRVQAFSEVAAAGLQTGK